MFVLELSLPVGFFFLIGISLQTFLFFSVYYIHVFMSLSYQGHCDEQPEVLQRSCSSPEVL